ncbi:HNH endonuclease [Peptostreptococcus stomatis]|uniref:HNH endonuclease n=1 Tax=Peptostreptococcus stomatis TaxID=341694 RepID=UPI0002EC319C|nr:HNH endonuclease [Peptostreptococcus stomatis]
MLKIIFIKENESLIIELSSRLEGMKFLNGILFNLIFEKDHAQQPIKIDHKNRVKVLEFLERKYSKYKEMNRLKKFFKDLSNAEYIYIFLYNDCLEEEYDTLKQSLLYYNNDYTEGEIVKEMKKVIDQKEKAKKFLDELPYEMINIIPDRRIFMGEVVKENRRCIYCGNDIKNGATFKDIAHAIPEALGNIKFFQNEECDLCNEYFSRNAEEDLCNYLIWERLKYGLKGKNNLPKFQLTDGRFAKFFDYENENYDIDWGRFEVVKKFVKENKVKGPVIISNKNISEVKDLEVNYVKDYIPQHIYKTLVKSVMGLIGNEFLQYFDETIKWLRYGNEYVELPKVAIRNSNRLIIEPELYIFKRKDIGLYAIPYCYAELRILDKIFIFIIPFTKNDRLKFVAEKECILFFNIISGIYGKYILEDFSCVFPKKIEKKFKVVKDII